MFREPQVADLLNNFETVSEDIAWAGPATAEAAGEFVVFAQRLDDFVESVARLVDTGEMPRMYLEDNGLVPFLQRLTDRLREIGPELAALLPGWRPLVDSLTTAAPRVDISSLIDQALRSTDEDSVRVRVGLK